MYSFCSEKDLSNDYLLSTSVDIIVLLIWVVSLSLYCGYSPEISSLTSASFSFVAKSSGYSTYLPLLIKSRLTNSIWPRHFSFSKVSGLFKLELNLMTLQVFLRHSILKLSASISLVSLISCYFMMLPWL